MFDRRSFLLSGLALTAHGALAANALSPALSNEFVSTDTPSVDLLYSPVNYGYRDHIVNGTVLGNRAVRVYFPSLGTAPSTASIRTGYYPLVFFCHGQRGAEQNLCPSDWMTDYRRWVKLVRLWARCGFIVVVPDLTSAHDESGAVLMEQLVGWLRSASSPYRSYMQWRDYNGVIVDDSLPNHNVACIGHSWGTKAIGALLRRRVLRPRCIGFANGTWDGDEATIRDWGLPLLLLTATQDEVISARTDYTNYLFAPLRPFTFQAALQRASHWSYSTLSYCDGNMNNYVPDPSDGPAAIASDLFVNFLSKYMYRRFDLASSLQAAMGARPVLADWYKASQGFALCCRWHDPLASSSFGVKGTRLRGTWVEASPW